ARLQALEWALVDPLSRAIWPLRGGYGATRLMQGLLKLHKPERHQWLIGFSDITALHLLANQQWGWPSIHGPVLAQLAEGKVDAASEDALSQLLLEGHYRLPPVTACNDAARHAVAPQPDDPIIGGN